MTKALISMLAIAMLCSCSGAEKNIITGADRDSHGCIGSAGYTWSTVKNDCIRIFEDGIRLNDAVNPNATMSAFAVFSTDKKQAEIFLPEQKKPILMSQNGSKWTAKKYELLRQNGKLLLLKNGKEAYRE